MLQPVDSRNLPLAKRMAFKLSDCCQQVMAYLPHHSAPFICDECGVIESCKPWSRLKLLLSGYNLTKQF